MGYYTRFKLEIDTDNPFIKDQIWDYINSPEVQDSEDYYGICNDGESCKWYDHDKYMLKLSKKFPEAVLVLNGEGEESGDLWVTYYKAGKMQHENAEIVYGDFDESKLE